MKYICLGFIDPNTFAAASQGEQEAMMDSCIAYDDQLRAKGHFKGGEALQPPNTAKTLRFTSGQLQVTDGPFAETKEQFGGYHLVECRDLDEAVALAMRIPTLPYGGVVEVRAVEAGS